MWFARISLAALSPRVGRLYLGPSLRYTIGLYHHALFSLPLVPVYALRTKEREHPLHHVVNWTSNVLFF
jgi:hypothetical protein